MYISLYLWTQNTFKQEVSRRAILVYKNMGIRRSLQEIKGHQGKSGEMPDKREDIRVYLEDKMNYFSAEEIFAPRVAEVLKDIVFDSQVTITFLKIMYFCAIAILHKDCDASTHCIINLILF